MKLTLRFKWATSYGRAQIPPSLCSQACCPAVQWQLQTGCQTFAGQKGERQSLVSPQQTPLFPNFICGLAHSSRRATQFSSTFIYQPARAKRDLAVNSTQDGHKPSCSQELKQPRERCFSEFSTFTCGSLDLYQTSSIQLIKGILE